MPSILTHTPLNKMAAIAQTFSNAFSRVKSFVFLFEFHWSLFLRVQLTIIYLCFGWWLDIEQAITDKPLPEPMLLSSMTHWCGNSGRWVNVNGFLQLFGLKVLCLVSQGESNSYPSYAPRTYNIALVDNTRLKNKPMSLIYDRSNLLRFTCSYFS